MPQWSPTLTLIILVLVGTVLPSCARYTDSRVGWSADDKDAEIVGSPVIVVGPIFMASEFGPSVDSDGDGTIDTYGPSDVVVTTVGFRGQVSGYSTLALTFQTGIGLSVTKKADACAYGPDFVNYCYRVRQGDRDGDGLSIPANAISIETYNGILVDVAHKAVPSQPNHRVDGNLRDRTPPRIGMGAPSILGLTGDTYRRGETIWLEASFTESIVIDTSGGMPTLELEIGNVIRNATYIGYEENNNEYVVLFAYAVQAGDYDDDGTIWVPASGLSVPAGSSIRDVAGNDALLSWSVSSGATGLYVDGD